MNSDLSVSWSGSQDRQMYSSVRLSPDVIALESLFKNNFQNLFFSFPSFFIPDKISFRHRLYRRQNWEDGG